MGSTPVLATNSKSGCIGQGIKVFDILEAQNSMRVKK